jgi:GTPase SAR1 family protein
LGVLAFDLTRPETFDAVTWTMLDDLMEHCAGIQCVLVGNKRDLFKQAEHQPLRNRSMLRRPVQEHQALAREGGGSRASRLPSTLKVKH